MDTGVLLSTAALVGVGLGVQLSHSPRIHRARGGEFVPGRGLRPGAPATAADLRAGDVIRWSVGGTEPATGDVLAVEDDGERRVAVTVRWTTGHNAGKTQTMSLGRIRPSGSVGMVFYRASGGTVTDDVLPGPHRDTLIGVAGPQLLSVGGAKFVTGEEAPERLHLGGGDGWVEPLLPPVGAKGRTVEYRQKGGRWTVRVREGGTVSGGREIAYGQGGSREAAFTKAMESAGAEMRFLGGPIAAAVLQAGQVADFAQHHSRPHGAKKRATGGRLCRTCGYAERRSGELAAGRCPACRHTGALLEVAPQREDLVLELVEAGPETRRAKGQQMRLLARGGRVA